MSVAVRVEPLVGHGVPAVDYAWDTDTEILRVAIRSPVLREGMTGSLDLEGGNGAWLTLELLDGRLAAVEVAVWPDVQAAETLVAPEAQGPVALLVPTQSGGGPGALEVDTSIRAVADAPERTIHFRIGSTRATTAYRVAADLLIELDARQRIAGLWFLNVPPFPQ